SCWSTVGLTAAITAATTLTLIRADCALKQRHLPTGHHTPALSTANLALASRREVHRRSAPAASRRRRFSPAGAWSDLARHVHTHG
ncbi:hypothetical protein, partial [Candidatus Amarolinea dominans]|uniref:hypothetical protein n=1 Tax=Candidatus Amarolinea dominans TaxID=3140696 RepID=UPI0031CCCD87